MCRRQNKPFYRIRQTGSSINLPGILYGSNRIEQQRRSRYWCITPTIAGEQSIAHGGGFGLAARVDFDQWIIGLAIITHLCLQNKACTVIYRLAFFESER